MIIFSVGIILAKITQVMCILCVCRISELNIVEHSR